jgi:hypothetical protein
MEIFFILKLTTLDRPMALIWGIYGLGLGRELLRFGDQVAQIWPPSPQM